MFAELEKRVANLLADDSSDEEPQPQIVEETKIAQVDDDLEISSEESEEEEKNSQPAEPQQQERVLRKHRPLITEKLTQDQVDPNP